MRQSMLPHVGVVFFCFFRKKDEVVCGDEVCGGRIVNPPSTSRVSTNVWYFIFSSFTFMFIVGALSSHNFNSNNILHWCFWLLRQCLRWEGVKICS